MLRSVSAIRYVTPLREGGSLPALVEADDDGLYVVKLRGAGQGEKALVAEVVVGELGRALGLAVPEIVLVNVDRRARGRRARPGDQGPDPGERGPERGPRLPAQRAHLLPGDWGRPGAGACGRRRLARRADGERGPDAAQPEPADLARAPVADRPWRRALSPARRPRPERGPRALSRRCATTCCCPAPAPSPRPTPASPSVSRRTCSHGSSTRCRPTGSAAPRPATT